MIRHVFHVNYANYTPILTTVVLRSLYNFCNVLKKPRYGTA